MSITAIRGKQVLDGTIQRADLDTTTAGQAVAAKIIQGTNISLNSTGADAGTGDVTVSAVGTSTTTTGSSFTVPASGSTTTVTVTDASWIIVGQLLYFAGAGGSGLAGALIVTAKTGNQLTVQTP